MIDLGLVLDLITWSDEGFTFTQTSLGQGREQAKTFLRYNRDVAARLEARIRSQLELLSEKRRLFKDEDEDPPSDIDWRQIIG